MDKDEAIDAGSPRWTPKEALRAAAAGAWLEAASAWRDAPEDVTRTPLGVALRLQIAVGLGDARAAEAALRETPEWLGALPCVAMALEAARKLVEARAEAERAGLSGRALGRRLLETRRYQDAAMFWTTLDDPDARSERALRLATAFTLLGKTDAARTWIAACAGGPYAERAAALAPVRQAVDEAAASRGARLSDSALPLARDLAGAARGARLATPYATWLAVEWAQATGEPEIFLSLARRCRQTGDVSMFDALPEQALDWLATSPDLQQTLTHDLRDHFVRCCVSARRHAFIDAFLAPAFEDADDPP